MHELNQLRDKLIDELKKYSSKDMNAAALEMVDKLAHAAKNVCKIVDDMGDYSEYGGAYGHMGYSNARYGRVKRDAMGRYSTTGDLANELRTIMSEVHEPSIRSDFERLIDKVERM